MFIKRVEPAASGFDCYLNDQHVGTRATEDTARTFLAELVYDAERGAPLPFEPMPADDIEQLPIPHVDGLPDDRAIMDSAYYGAYTALDRRNGQVLIARKGGTSVLLEGDTVIALYHLFNSTGIHGVMLELQCQRLLADGNPVFQRLITAMDAALASETEPTPAKRASASELPSVERLRRQRAKRQARQNPAN